MKGFFKLLARFVPPYKKLLALNVLFNVLAAFLTLFSFALIIPILEMLFGINQTTYSFMAWGSASVKILIAQGYMALREQNISRRHATVSPSGPATAS